MNRYLLFLGCFLASVFWVFLQAYSGVSGAARHTLAAAQVSPLTSPLIAPLSNTVSSTVQSTAIVAATSSIAITTVNHGSPVSLVLVAAVFVGIVVVIGLVIWRQR